MINLSLDNNLISYALFFIVLGFSKIFVTKFLYKKYLQVKGVTLPSKSAERSFALSLYKFLYYVSALLVSAAALQNEDWVFATSKLRIPLFDIPLRFKLYYTYELAFYSVEIVTIFYEPHKRDFYQMLLHHFSTILLMILSFNVKYIKFGLVILLLHDSSDPLLEFSKIHNRMQSTVISSVSFILFTMIFVILRLFVYPRYVLTACYKTLFVQSIELRESVIMGLLFALQIMHIIWTKYIALVIIKVFISGEMKDSREKSD